MKSPFARRVSSALILGLMLSAISDCRNSAAESGWHSLPLISNGKVDPNWVHTGYGGFSVDNGTLRTDCDPRGLGLLVYKKERLGNCQIRVVFREKETKSNSGVYIRIADGILDQVGHPGPAFDRDAKGTPSPESMEKVKATAEAEQGAWYAVHRGFEVQIDGSGDTWHRTGSIYSLAPAKDSPPGKTDDWQTMIITLDGEKVSVELNGQKVSSFDPIAPGLSARKQWHEPKREPKRPTVGYLGLQNHDPGDVVWFKEVSVRPLASAK